MAILSSTSSCVLPTCGSMLCLLSRIIYEKGLKQEQKLLIKGSDVTGIQSIESRYMYECLSLIGTTQQSLLAAGRDCCVVSSAFLHAVCFCALYNEQHAYIVFKFLSL